MAICTCRDSGEHVRRQPRIQQHRRVDLLRFGEGRALVQTADSEVSSVLSNGTEAAYIEKLMLQTSSFAAGRRPEPQPQRVQLDEALRVDLVVGALVVLERHHLHRIKAVRAFAPDAR